MLHDKVHMKPEHLEKAFEHYAKESFGWDITYRTKNDTYQAIKDKIRREGKCNKCGGHKKRCDPCRERVRCSFCDNNHHDISVCPVRYRPCLTCGCTSPHDRKNCTGWW